MPNHGHRLKRYCLLCVQICLDLESGDWKVGHSEIDTIAKSPFASNTTEAVTFDDLDSLAEKVRFTQGTH